MYSAINSFYSIVAALATGPSGFNGLGVNNGNFGIRIGVGFFAGFSPKLF
jgi:hypothetical protein